MQPPRRACTEAAEASRPHPATPASPDGSPPGALTPSDTMNVYCRTCRRALSTHTRLGEITYHHAAELRGEPCDHTPDPVPLAEVPDPVMVCDYCSDPHPVWIYLCGDQVTEFRAVTGQAVDLGDYRKRHGAARVLRTDTAPGLASAWGQRWTACQACATCIEDRDLYGLIGRVTEVMPAKLTRGKRLVVTRGRLHGTFSAVFDTLLPGRGRITPEAPLGVWETPPAPVADPGPAGP